MSDKPVPDVTQTALANVVIPSGGDIASYIKYVNTIAVLTEDEEKSLANRWRVNQDVDAARFLVLSHLRLVVSIARGYMGYGLPLADIIQEGTIGLMKAVHRFNETKGARLVTFATHWIRAAINDYVIKNWRIIKTVTTKDQRKLFFKLRSHREDTANMTDNEAEHIAQILDVNKADVIEMNTRLTGGDVSILPDDEGSYAPIDYLSDINDTPDRIIERKIEDKIQTTGIEKALSALDERSRDIVVSRWLLDHDDQQTLQSLANKYQVSAERIRQIEEAAMKKMRKHLKQYT